MTREEAIKVMFYVKNHFWNDAEVNTALDMAIEELKEQQWIPCSERLPNDGHNVLMCRKNGVVGEGCYHSIIGEWSQFRWNAIGVKDVIAWMPLPEPYGAKMD